AERRAHPCRTRYPPAVLDEGFFLTLAGLAMSFAGFAGLMNALRRRGETWEPMELYQLRIIVAYAITTLFGSLLVVPFVEMLGQHDGVQWLGALMLIASSALGVGNMRSDIRGGHGTVLRTRVRATFTTITVVGLIALVGTVITGAPALYRLALILLLAMPAGTLAYVVARINRYRSAATVASPSLVPGVSSSLPRFFACHVQALAVRSENGATGYSASFGDHQLNAAARRGGATVAAVQDTVRTGVPVARSALSGTIMSTPKRLARIAGVLYLIVGIFGGFALAYVSPLVYVPGDATATAAKVAANADLVRIGVLADLLQATVFVFLAMTLYLLLARVQRNVAMAMVILAAI